VSVWPLATADLPAAGGRIKEVPEDFVVEELPAYEPAGTGEHLYLWVEKKNLNTQDVVRALARHCEISPDDIGTAGLKDRQAVTFQYLSLPAKAEPKIAGFALEGVRVHRQVRHGNKLRTGHLRGNRFRLRLRQVQNYEALEKALERLKAHGVPNYFGEQRFGVVDDNATLGRMLLKGERLPRKPQKFQRKLYLSAFQSLLFNKALAQRVKEGSFAKALLGDVMKKEETGGVFVCEAPAVDQGRVDLFEISPAGPMFGPDMVPAQAEVAAREAALLEEAGVEPADFERGKGETQGTRRPYRVLLRNTTLQRDEEVSGAWLTFELSRGAYATVVLEELLKPSQA